MKIWLKERGRKHGSHASAVLPGFGILALWFGLAPGVWAFQYPPSSIGRVEPSVARDYNPDPDVVEVVLIAVERELRVAQGKRTKVWTYNGVMPGPTIEGKLGDTLIVHFFNFLPEETTVHWHGLELPANMDGSNIAQGAIPPGGYFRYEFVFLRASTFWYHPHIRTNKQVERGLYGALVVHDWQQDVALRLPHREHVLVLDDLLLDANGQIPPPFPDDPLENAIMQVNGREGNVLLVNGRARARGWIRRGVPHRLRLINASNSRFMRVSIPEHTLWRIGGDGGLLESPIRIPAVESIEDPENAGVLISDPDPGQGILLTPGERADVVFSPHGWRPIRVEWHDIPRGRHTAFYNDDGSIGLGHDHMDGKRPPKTLLTLGLFGPPRGKVDYLPPASLREIESIDATDAPSIMSMFGHTLPDLAGNVTFFVQMKDGMPLPFDEVTEQDAPIVNVGETRVWEIHNMTAGDHNFHTHGFHFQLIETECVNLDDEPNSIVVPASYLEDKDTIMVPRRPGAKGRSRTIVRVAMRFGDEGREGEVEAFGKIPDEDTSGGWLFHCHILEHSARGMMSFFQVLNNDR